MWKGFIYHICVNQSESLCKLYRKLIFQMLLLIIQKYRKVYTIILMGWHRYGIWSPFTFEREITFKTTIALTSGFLVNIALGRGNGVADGILEPCPRPSTRFFWRNILLVYLSYFGKPVNYVRMTFATQEH